MKNLNKILVVTLISLTASASFAEVCFSIDATKNLASNTFNVENCGPTGTNLIVVPTSAKVTVTGVEGAGCKRVATTQNLNGLEIRVDYDLDIDSEQSCNISIIDGEKEAILEFVAVGS